MCPVTVVVVVAVVPIPFFLHMCISTQRNHAKSSFCLCSRVLKTRDNSRRGRCDDKHVCHVCVCVCVSKFACSLDTHALSRARVLRAEHSCRSAVALHHATPTYPPQAPLASADAVIRHIGDFNRTTAFHVSEVHVHVQFVHVQFVHVQTVGRRRR